MFLQKFIKICSISRSSESDRNKFSQFFETPCSDSKLLDVAQVLGVPHLNLSKTSKLSVLQTYV